MSWVSAKRLQYFFNKIKTIFATKIELNNVVLNSVKSVGTVIPENSNLNTYTANGVYYSSGSASSVTITNSPFTTCGYRLMVVPTIEGNGYKKQIVIPSGRNTIAVRSYYSNEWTEWAYFENVGELSGLQTTNKKSIVNAINELASNTYNLSGGTAIPEGADINTYKTIGNYYCTLNKTAETLVNSPTTKAFKLKVSLATGGTYPSQEMTLYNTGTKLYRWYNTETSEWSGWRFFEPTGDLNLLTTNAKSNIVSAINEVDGYVEWLNANALNAIGAEIPEGTDLDTFTTFGVHRSPNADRSKSLNNAPYTGCGFRFVTIPTITSNQSYMKQIAIPSRNDTYAVRTYLTDGWTDWKFVGEVVDSLTSTKTDIPLSANQGRVLNDRSIQTYTQSSGTLTGSGTNGKFKATKTATYSSFTIGGTSYAVNAGDETSIDLVSGVWYSFILDTSAKTINFKSGGGVPDGTTATPVNDVKKWQKCAGLKTGYTTVAQILADTATLKELLYNSNAKEYMIRSATIMSAVLANSNAISILDNSMPFINPAMSSNNAPYGTVTKSFSNSYNYYGIFTPGTSIATEYSYYYTAGNGHYIQWLTTADRGVVPYKFTAYDTYGQNVVAKYVGIDESGNTFDLTDNFTIPKRTLVTVQAKTFKRCIGFRLHIVTASNGANNWSQFCNCKMYAI